MYLTKYLSFVVSLDVTVIIGTDRSFVLFCTLSVPRPGLHPLK